MEGGGELRAPPKGRLHTYECAGGSCAHAKELSRGAATPNFPPVSLDFFEGTEAGLRVEGIIEYGRRLRLCSNQILEVSREAVNHDPIGRVAKRIWRHTLKQTPSEALREDGTWEIFRCGRGVTPNESECRATKRSEEEEEDRTILRSTASRATRLTKRCSPS